MNFFTSSFKKNAGKKSCLLFLASLLICFLGLNLAISVYEKRKTSAVRYIDIITSKYKHMQLNHPKDTLDVVFIGSSRTYFHIDTSYLTRHGLPSYNLSMLACFPLSFPSMIENAKKVSPQAIGLGVDVDYFYNDFEERIPTPAISDIKAQLAANLDNKIISRSILDYVEKIPPLSRYATTIATKGQSIFDRFTESYFVDPAPIKDTNEPAHKTPEFDTENKIIQIQKLKDDYYSVKCANGDGILFGSALTGNRTAFLKRNPPKELRQQNIDFMNYLIHLAEQDGTKVFVYLCAKVDSPEKYDLESLRKSLDAPVIDTVRFVPGSPEYWGDLGHLNSKGRDIYTKKLMAQINQLYTFNRQKTMRTASSQPVDPESSN